MGCKAAGQAVWNLSAETSLPGLLRARRLGRTITPVLFHLRNCVAAASDIDEYHFGRLSISSSTRLGAGLHESSQTSCRSDAPCTWKRLNKAGCCRFPESRNRKLIGAHLRHSRTRRYAPKLINRPILAYRHCQHGTIRCVQHSEAH